MALPLEFSSRRIPVTFAWRALGWGTLAFTTLFSVEALLQANSTNWKVNLLVGVPVGLLGVWTGARIVWRRLELSPSGITQVSWPLPPIHVNWRDVRELYVRPSRMRYVRHADLLARLLTLHGPILVVSPHLGKRIIVSLGLFTGDNGQGLLVELARRSDKTVIRATPRFLGPFQV